MRIPKALMLIQIGGDAVGERETFSVRYCRARWLILAMAPTVGSVYAVLGAWITRLRLGPEHVAKDPLSFIVSRAGIVRLPSFLALR